MMNGAIVTEASKFLRRNHKKREKFSHSLRSNPNWKKYCCRKRTAGKLEFGDPNNESIATIVFCSGNVIVVTLMTQNGADQSAISILSAMALTTRAETPFSRAALNVIPVT